MKPDATRFFVCPECHGELRLQTDDSDEVMEGRLECGCGRQYPIHNGVPRFVEREGYTDTFGRQWTRWARTQHDSLNASDIEGPRCQIRIRLQRQGAHGGEGQDGIEVAVFGANHEHSFLPAESPSIFYN